MNINKTISPPPPQRHDEPTEVAGYWGQLPLRSSASLVVNNNEQKTNATPAF
jgi:hypothetical protein